MCVSECIYTYVNGARTTHPRPRTEGPERLTSDRELRGPNDSPPTENRGARGGGGGGGAQMGRVPFGAPGSGRYNCADPLGPSPYAHALFPWPPLCSVFGRCLYFVAWRRHADQDKGDYASTVYIYIYIYIYSHTYIQLHIYICTYTRKYVIYTYICV